MPITTLKKALPEYKPLSNLFKQHILNFQHTHPNATLFAAPIHYSIKIQMLG